jgi:hypothetical protein
MSPTSYQAAPSRVVLLFNFHLAGAAFQAYLSRNDIQSFHSAEYPALFCYLIFILQEQLSKLTSPKTIFNRFAR